MTLLRRAHRALVYGGDLGGTGKATTVGKWGRGGRLIIGVGAVSLLCDHIHQLACHPMPPAWASLRERGR
uniref:Uncharacterized protein n=1 Tax=Oryza rufipogon TaxID=4529 RepID=A0A0E0QPR4_ORYRU